jgi:hypothetical protein
MPWSQSSFAKHNHSLTGPQSGHAARIANAVLRKSGDEGMSIAVANKYFQKARGGIVGYDEGGGILDPTSDNPGLTPTSGSMSPIQRGMAQRYSSLPTEKLAELAVMMGGSPQGQMIQRILAQKRTMPEQAPYEEEQASRASGGVLERPPPSTHFDQSPGSTAFSGAKGYLHGPTAGRADDIMTHAPAGSHVIPADVVAGFGEGNSMAGANAWSKMLQMGPGGIPMPSGGGGRRMGMPAPPAPYRDPSQKARGGAQADMRPVALSHGEFVVTPEEVMALGQGDMERGHVILDEIIVEARKEIIAQMSKLPKPVGMKK